MSWLRLLNDMDRDEVRYWWNLDRKPETSRCVEDQATRTRRRLKRESYQQINHCESSLSPYPPNSMVKRVRSGLFVLRKGSIGPSPRVLSRESPAGPWPLSCPTLKLSDFLFLLIIPLDQFCSPTLNIEAEMERRVY